MTATILQHNGQVVYRSTYQPLTVEQQANVTNAEGRMGAKITHNELKVVSTPNMPEYIPYSDEDQNETDFPDLDQEIIPEVRNEYVHAPVMLPHGRQMICSTVITCKQDPDGNPIGC